MINVTLDSLCNESEEVYVHASKKVAKKWLKNLPNTTNDGCSILVFYRNNHGNIRALLPQNTLLKINEALRILGARNEVEEKFWEEIGDYFRGVKVPRLARLKGDEIVPDKPHGILIVYEKGKGSIGKYFFEILSELNTKLVKQVEISATNDPSLQINARQLMDQLSLLAIGKYKEKTVDCKLLSGRIYFINDDKVYRYTFKMNPDNPNEEAMLDAEKRDKLAKRNEVYTEKSINHHYWSTLKGYFKSIVLGIVLGFVGGGIAFAFLSLAGVPFLAPIGAAVVGVVAAILTVKTGINQVIKKNKSTVECGPTIFREVPNIDSLESQFVAKPNLLPLYSSVNTRVLPPLSLGSDKNHNVEILSDSQKKPSSYISSLLTCFPFFRAVEEKYSKAVLDTATKDNTANSQLNRIRMHG
ncbi:MAG: hypothetical protein V4471_01620 [Pseudomonadota bacterium]